MAAYVTSVRAPWRVPFLMGLAATAALGLAACGKVGLGGSDQMGWARAALERNDRLEVVAADPATNSFTVRIKDTGDLRMVRADQIVAGPPGLILSAPAAPGATPAGAPGTSAGGTSEGATGPDTNPAAKATPGESARADNSAAPAAGQVGPPDTDAAAAPGPANSPSMRQSNRMANVSIRRSSGQDGSSGDDGSVPRTGFRPDPAPAAEAPNPNSDVASITPGGRLLESGPGYAIKTASNVSKASSTPARAERERSATTSAAVERRHDPIICQGDRLLQIDNRNLEFDGDAVSAEDGCEIHITNSHITAKGVGVSVRAANVHIDNSQIEGDAASIDASNGAQVYASFSRFKGMSRRLDNSSFHDLGGNVWN
jgi:hypothetical protein